MNFSCVLERMMNYFCITKWLNILGCVLTMVLLSLFILKLLAVNKGVVALFSICNESSNTMIINTSENIDGSKILSDNPKIINSDSELRFKNLKQFFVKKTLNSVVRVSNLRKTNDMLIVDKGSGVFITDVDKNYYILTAAHLFRDGIGKICVQITSQHTVIPLFLWKDEVADIALLIIQQKDRKILEHVVPMSFSGKYPQVNDCVFVSGYGMNGKQHTYKGAVLGYVKKTPFSEYDTMKIACSVQQGDSGGPVYDINDQICGLVWGTDGNYSYASYNLKIMSIIDSRCPGFFNSNKSQESDNSYKRRNFKSDRRIQNICGFVNVINKLKNIWIDLVYLNILSVFLIIVTFISVCKKLFLKKQAIKKN